MNAPHDSARPPAHHQPVRQHEDGVRFFRQKATKALSVQQPWAWLIVNGYKPVENRTWRTLFRGPTLIHAGLKADPEGYLWVQENFPDIPLPPFQALERGGVVGEAVIVNCVSHHDSPWFFGPLGFVIDGARPLPLERGPGKLGIFDWRPAS